VRTERFASVAIIKIIDDGKGNLIGVSVSEDNSILGLVMFHVRGYNDVQDTGREFFVRTKELEARVKGLMASDALKDAAITKIYERLPTDSVYFVSDPAFIKKIGDSGGIPPKPVIAVFLDP